MSEREMHDFMSVDSFSQLPSIRSAPKRGEPAASGPAIRLFGFNVPQQPDADPGEEAEAASKDTANDSSSNSNDDDNDNNKSNSNGISGGENGRKFECHYCCRNFPTSQALGGHQNAHKRERQHAKRAHFQSAMAAQQQHPGTYGYNLVGYRWLSSISGHAFEPAPPPHYPSWNTSISAGGPPFYSELSFMSQPMINGGLLPGLWRVPPARTQCGPGTGSMPLPLPLVESHDEYSRMVGMGRGGGGGGGSSSPSTSSTSRHPYELMPVVKESVSLDLHL